MCVLSVSPSRHSISEWRMQSIARDSDDSSDEEFFDAHGNHSFYLFIFRLESIVRSIDLFLVLSFAPSHSACIS